MTPPAPVAEGNIGYATGSASRRFPGYLTARRNMIDLARNDARFACKLYFDEGKAGVLPRNAIGWTRGEGAYPYEHVRHESLAHALDDAKRRVMSGRDAYVSVLVRFGDETPNDDRDPYPDVTVQRDDGGFVTCEVC